ncbi:MAG: hypothetical protein K2O96_06700, partial [Lachnospiraceae bacterium]|nr:hypothetical protein [Lachnospiraceae bacterium]
VYRAGTARINACGDSRLRGLRSRKPTGFRRWVVHRFYRVDKSHSKETGGTGLGLSIVKHAVAYHHGKIDIESKVDDGTIIEIKFPM